jgi:hypothetical protein
LKLKRSERKNIVADGTLTLAKNTGAFLPGDMISITEKIDGANASI